MLFRSGTAYFKVAQALALFLKASVPQISSTTQTMIHGVSDFQISAVSGRTTGFGGARLTAEISALGRAPDLQKFAGCQIFRKPISAAIEISDAAMSTIHGLTKFETTNCGMAKD